MKPPAKLPLVTWAVVLQARPADIVPAPWQIRYVGIVARTPRAAEDRARSQLAREGWECGQVQRVTAARRPDPRRA